MYSYVVVAFAITALWTSASAHVAGERQRLQISEPNAYVSDSSVQNATDLSSDVGLGRDVKDAGLSSMPLDFFSLHEHLNCSKMGYEATVFHTLENLEYLRTFTRNGGRIRVEPNVQKIEYNRGQIACIAHSSVYVFNSWHDELWIPAAHIAYAVKVLLDFCKLGEKMDYVAGSVDVLHDPDVQESAYSVYVGGNDFC